MLTKTPYIVEQFQYIVEDVATRYGDTVNYQFGHVIEIINTLKELSKTQRTSPAKFPLVCLFQDFTEEKGGASDTESKVKLNLIVAMMTKPTYTASDRYRITLKPVLYPIYEILITSIIRSGYYKLTTLSKPPKHKKTDRLFWGKSGLYGSAGNQFNDYIDAIEITDLELEVYKQHCEPTSNL